MRTDAILNGKMLAVTEAQMQKLAGLGELFGMPEKREESRGYDLAGDVAVVHVRGMVSHGLSEAERSWLDAFDTEEVADALSAAVADGAVRAVVLDVNSPGGMVVGTPELAGAVKAANAEKPVVAHTSSLMASAAYWMAAGAERILTTESAEVGSVGCYTVHVDLSAHDTMDGIRPVVFRSGENKAAGVFGTKLSPAQARDIQASVDAVGAQFREAVKAARAGVEDGAMDGRVFTGADAVKFGLADGISDLAGAVRAAREAADERERQTMEAEQEIARLKGELEAANGLLAEAEKTMQETRDLAKVSEENVEAAKVALAESQAQTEAAKAESARLAEELEKTKAELDEKTRLLAAAPSALRTAGTTPVEGLYGGGEGKPADWKSALDAAGGDYVKARRDNPDAWKASLKKM